MKKTYIIIGTIVILLLAVRIALPYIVKDQINKQINSIEGYSGGVESVSLQLFRGAFQLHNLNIFEDASTDPSIPFISFKHNDVSLDWRALVRGEIVAEIYVDSLIVNLTVREEEKIDEEKDDRIRFAEQLEQMMPIEVNILRITNGEIAYNDPTTEPEVNVYLSDFNLEAENLRNVVDEQDTLPAHVRIQSRAMDTGYITMHADLNFMKEIPDFEFMMELENIDLSRFNDFTEAYGKFSINQGLLNLYAESAALDGFLSGYIKPIIEELEVTPTDEDEGLLREIYENVLDFFAGIFESAETDYLGTRVDFEGQLDDPEVDVWSAVWVFLRNAFVESISKGIEDTIDIDELF